LPRKKIKKKKEEAYVFVLLFFLIGFGLLLSGNLMGVIAIGLGILVLIAIEPAFQKFIVEIIKALSSLVGKYERKSIPTPETTLPQYVETVRDANLSRVIDILENCPLPSKFRHEPENDAETWISSQLIHDFPKLRRQQYYSQYHSRFDIEIGDIGIEVKLPKGARDLTTLRGQIQIYFKRFKYVVVFIINYYRINPELIEDFQKDMELEYGERIVVIERKWR
jgi:hypothetical protein